MSKEEPFDPDWCVHPGATVNDILLEKKITLQEFAESMNVSWDEAQNILSGAKELSEDLCIKLSHHVGSSPGFWINREAQFRKGLRDGLAWEEDPNPEIRMRNTLSAVGSILRLHAKAHKAEGKEVPLSIQGCLRRLNQYAR